MKLDERASGPAGGPAPGRAIIGGGRRIVLASASPRRAALLRQVGMAFETVPARIDETLAETGLLNPTDAVMSLAEAKARKVIAGLSEGPVDVLVIGADTVVVVGGRLLGKPADQAMARDMLGLLSGRTHTVYTGIAVLDALDGRVERGAEQTQVSMAALGDDTIRRYVATGEPMDKAGAYAVQGLGSLFIDRIEGCYFNVVGLPLALLHRLLSRLGHDVTGTWRPPARSGPAGRGRTSGVLGPRPPQR